MEFVAPAPTVSKITFFTQTTVSRIRHRHLKIFYCVFFFSPLSSRVLLSLLRMQSSAEPPLTDAVSTASLLQQDPMEKVALIHQTTVRT